MQRGWKLRKVKIGGFTLIELMMALAIAGVLLGIAYGSYTSSVRKSRRTEAKTALLDIAGRQERYFSTNLAYSTTFPPLGFPGAPAQMPVGNGYYKVELSNVNVGPPSTYTITAKPAGAQTADTECGNFIIDQTGVQSVSGSGTRCW